MISFRLVDKHVWVLEFHPFLQWITFLDSEGRVADSEALKKRIFYGGVEHILRKEVCTYLLESCMVLLNRIVFLFSVLLIMKLRSGHSCWDTMRMIQHVQKGNIFTQ